MNYKFIIHINTYYYHTYPLHKHKALFQRHINFNLERREIFDMVLLFDCMTIWCIFQLSGINFSEASIM